MQTRTPQTRTPITPLMILTFLTSCTPKLFECGNTTIGEQLPPGGKYIATIYHRDCGATTAVSVNVSLRPSSAKFAAEDFPPVFVGDESSLVATEWRDATHLTIRIVSQGTAFKSVPQWRDVVIEYSGSSS